jgi:hypothetical protein
VAINTAESIWANTAKLADRKAAPKAAPNGVAIFGRFSCLGLFESGVRGSSQTGVDIAHF